MSRPIILLMINALPEDNLHKILDTWEKKCQTDYKNNVNFHGYALLIEMIWADLKKGPFDHDFEPGGRYYKR